MTPEQHPRGGGREESLPPLCAGAPGLAATGLAVSRGETPVLWDVDLRVGPGEHLAVVGPNGSGKSTLLLALVGLLPPDAGAVCLDGAPLGGIAAEVGLVLANPEDQGICPVVEDDVAFGLENRGLAAPAIRGRVEEALRAVGLWGLRAAPVQTLSGGQAQKLALASVLALGARYLLLDEATSMLSPWDRDALMLALDRLKADGVGVVQVTHEAEELLCADRVAWLQAGRVAFHGTPEAFFRRGDCPWRAPEYLSLAEAVGRSGAAVPSYAAVVRWLAVPA